jgi:hypothetical protein
LKKDTQVSNAEYVTYDIGGVKIVFRVLLCGASRSVEFKVAKNGSLN